MPLLPFDKAKNLCNLNFLEKSQIAVKGAPFGVSQPSGRFCELRHSAIRPEIRLHRTEG
jgi:hypothetical protein